MVAYAPDYRAHRPKYKSPTGFSSYKGRHNKGDQNPRNELTGKRLKYQHARRELLFIDSSFRKIRIEVIEYNGTRRRYHCDDRSNDYPRQHSLSPGYYAVVRAPGFIHPDIDSNPQDNDGKQADNSPDGRQLYSPVETCVYGIEERECNLNSCGGKNTRDQSDAEGYVNFHAPKLRRTKPRVKLQGVDKRWSA